MYDKINEWLEWRDKTIVEQAKEIEYLRKEIKTLKNHIHMMGCDLDRLRDAPGNVNEAVKAIRETTERTIAKCFDDMIKEMK
jgi:nitrogen fixation/metabolism regulation signal transduction histidine kinase